MTHDHREGVHSFKIKHAKAQHRSAHKRGTHTIYNKIGLHRPELSVIFHSKINNIDINLKTEDKLHYCKQLPLFHKMQWYLCMRNILLLFRSKRSSR